MYHTKLALIPDFNIGLSILTGSDSAPMKRNAGIKVISIVSNEIIRTILPSLDNIAKEKAKRTFAGSYASYSCGLTHSIVVEVDSNPGLKLTKWDYNGADVLKELGRPLTNRSQVFDFRLQPNELYSDKRVGFTGVSGSDAWETGNLFRYGTVGLEQFAFEVDDSGVAFSVRCLALRDTLKRLWISSCGSQ